MRRRANNHHILRLDVGWSLPFLFSFVSKMYFRFRNVRRHGKKKIRIAFAYCINAEKIKVNKGTSKICLDIDFGFTSVRFIYYYFFFLFLLSSGDDCCAHVSYYCKFWFFIQFMCTTFDVHAIHMSQMATHDRWHIILCRNERTNVLLCFRFLLWAVSQRNQSTCVKPKTKFNSYN